MNSKKDKIKIFFSLNALNNESISLFRIINANNIKKEINKFLKYEQIK